MGAGMSELERADMRAGHADREQVVTRLNTAFAEGRLEVGELEERVAAAYAARTLGELVPLTADLPGPHQVPVGGPRRAADPVPRHRPAGRHRPPITGALGFFLFNVLIWGIISVSTWNMIYFWPIWTAIPLVFAIAGTLGSRRRC
jgi:hypothetical protein